jgi:hypothetical protein
MARTRPHLHELQMASPCSADWDEMKGTERVRRCRRCHLNVYRISDLTREEAEEVVEDAEGERCTSLYRRQDGTVLVEDCPRGVAAARRASRWWKERMFHLFLLVLPWIIITGFLSIDADTKEGRFSLTDIEPFKSLDLLASRPTAPGGLKRISILTTSVPPPPVGFPGGIMPDDPGDEVVFPPGGVPDPDPDKPQ